MNSIRNTLTFGDSHLSKIVDHHHILIDVQPSIHYFAPIAYTAIVNQDIDRSIFGNDVIDYCGNGREVTEVEGSDDGVVFVGCL